MLINDVVFGTDKQKIEPHVLKVSVEIGNDGKR